MAHKWLALGVCFSAAACVLVGMILWSEGEDVAPQGSDFSESSPREPPYREDVPSGSRSYAERLVEAGWESRAAEAVADLNREWFDILAEENPHGLHLQLKLLGDLGRHPALQSFIVEHPETAGLLAAADNPQRIAESLSRIPANYAIFSSLYVQHASPSEAADLAEALIRQGEMIVALQQRGLIGSELALLFDRDDPATREYDVWLKEVWLSKAAASEEELAGWIDLIFRHGGAIRDRLRHNEDFRRRFRTELWPRFVRAVEAHSIGVEPFLDDKRVWDLVALDSGEELLRLLGPLPICLIFGGPEEADLPYPAELHSRIIPLLLRREELTVNALWQFRREPLFHELLKRQLSEETLAAALQKLIEAGPNYPATLELFARLSDTALTEEVGPPTSGLITWVPLYYTLWEVPKKLYQGRPVSNMDWFSAILDPPLILLDITTGGGSAAPRRVLVAVSKEAAERATKEVAEKGAEKFFVITLRDSGLELARKRLGKEVAEKLGEKEVAQWSVTALWTTMQQTVKNAFAKATTFEITQPVRFMFQYSGVGRASFNRWTGLEARLFMRGDAKVFVRLTNVGNVASAVVGRRGLAFLERTAEDLTIGAVVESELGQKTIEMTGAAARSAKEQLRAWQQNVSAWWLLHATAPAVNTVQTTDAT